MNTKEPVTVLHHILKSKRNPKIKLLGDSITHGVGGSGWEQNGTVIYKDYAQSPNSFCWANLLRDYMKEKYGATVVNNGCTGTTVEFVTRHIPELVDPDDDLIICTIGTNNRHQYFADGEKPAREAFLAALYEKIAHMYGAFCDKGIPTIFVANIPASEQNEKDGEDYWRILRMSDINDCYKRLAREHGACVLSLYDLVSAYCKKNGVSIDALLCDGLHPNDDGYRVMFDLLVKALEL